MAAIGILGGMGPQASNKLYELLIKKTTRYTNAAIDEDYPEIVLLNVPVPNFISDKTKISQAKNMLIKRTKLLEQAGCTINGIACNTIHLILPELQANTNIPFVSLPKLVAAKIDDAGYRRVGLLATPTTLKSQLYDQELTEVELIRPNGKLVGYVEDIIYKQLAGELTKGEQKVFRQNVDKFIRLKNLEAVILGCTELPLAYGESDNPRIINTLDILADELLEIYFSA
jgi:aspartate racemase